LVALYFGTRPGCGNDGAGLSLSKPQVAANGTFGWSQRNALPSVPTQVRLIGRIGWASCLAGTGNSALAAGRENAPLAGSISSAANPPIPLDNRRRIVIIAWLPDLIRT